MAMGRRHSTLLMGGSNLSSCWLVFLLVVLGTSGLQLERPELSFDESRFLAVDQPHLQATAPQPAMEAVPPAVAGSTFTQARDLANADHIELGALPPPPSQFSFRELLSLSGDSSSSSESSSESSEESSSSGAHKGDRFIKELIQNMKFVAAIDDPDKEQALIDGLSTIKDEIVYKANMIKKNKEWVKKVHFLVKVYVKKIRRVEDHLKKLVNNARILLHKKQQILNMIKDKKLQKRLKLVRADLDVVHAALQNIKSSEKTFNGRTKDVKKTIGLMEATLKDMRTKERKREKEEIERKKHGEEESEEESSEESSQSIS